MQKISFILMLLICSLGCKKEVTNSKIKTVDSSDYTVNESKSGFEGQYISREIPIEGFDEINSFLQTAYWSELTENIGNPLLDCSFQIDGDGFTKYVVPYQINPSDEIENILIAFKSVENCWRIKIVNKYHYLLLYQTTDYFANHLFYEGLLNEFDILHENCESLISSSGIRHQTQIDLRNKKVIASISFNDGTTWQIFEDGSIEINNGGGACGPGCSGDGLSGTITWNDGRSYTFPGDNSSGNSNGVNPFNWNGKEDSGFKCGKCTNLSGGGGSNSSSGPLCEDPYLWSNTDPQVKKDYVNALSDLINHFDIEICGGSVVSNCLSTIDLLCIGLDSDCISLSSGHFQTAEFTECMTEVLAVDPAYVPETKSSVISKYLIKIGLDVGYTFILSDCVKTLDGPNGPMDIYMDEDCAKDALVSDFETRNNITLTPDESEIIKDNPFLVDLLEEYMDCMEDQDPDPNRRNLGRIANYIRDTYLDSEIEKRMFEKFMLGDDSIEAITPEECAEIMALIQNDPSYTNWHFSHEETVNGNVIRYWSSGDILYLNDKYNLALGTTDFTTNDDGDVIGISDTYDFDVHTNTTEGNGFQGPVFTLMGLDCEGRTFKREWQTRMVAVWAAIKWRSKSFEISCP